MRNEKMGMRNGKWECAKSIDDWGSGECDAIEAAEKEKRKMEENKNWLRARWSINTTKHEWTKPQNNEWL